MMLNRMSHLPLGLGIVAAVAPLPGATPGNAADPKVSKDVIAVQIRKQGFECKKPLSATRDAAAAKPDEAAWILKCEGVAYKVRLVPKQAAKVERIDDKPAETEQPASDPKP